MVLDHFFLLGAQSKNREAPLNGEPSQIMQGAIKATGRGCVLPVLLVTYLLLAVPQDLQVLCPPPAAKPPLLALTERNWPATPSQVWKKEITSLLSQYYQSNWIYIHLKCSYISCQPKKYLCCKKAQFLIALCNNPILAADAKDLVFIIQILIFLSD